MLLELRRLLFRFRAGNCRILQHDRGKVPRGEGAVDVARVALAAEVGEIAAVVNMRVTQNDAVKGLGVEGKIPVPLDRLVAFALEQAALEEEPSSVDFEQKHRASGRAGGAKEVDLHGVR